MACYRVFPAMLLGLIILSGCVATVPPVEVTRFHNATSEQIVPGSISIERVQLEGTSLNLEQASYSAAVMRELQRIGFTDQGAEGDQSIYITRVTVEQNRFSPGARRSPVSVGVGGSTGSYGSGVGVGIGINLAGKPKDRVATELSVRIFRRSDGQAIWEGRSQVEAKAGSPAAQPGLAASKLAEALFRDFPGESGTTIRVP
ncbi:DUF4136 domain-containing protein [Parasphingorhabdus sp.]|uniref:DUF4136 domain-containing protein n=1 Tax=Parasphingorhabdus sp. TaxID=2709688 RepID=UPI003D2D748A